MQWHDPEVQYLYRGPEHIVGLQRWDIDILELSRNSTLASSFGQCHECEEDAETCNTCQPLPSTPSHAVRRHTNRRKNQLIKRNPLQRIRRRHALHDRKRIMHPSKPLKLYRGHQETIAHESRQSFKVERCRAIAGGGYEVAGWP